MVNWIGELLGKVPVAIADYFNERQKLKSAERVRRMDLEDAIHVRRVELISKGLAADATWEVEQIKNSGYKDEWVLGVISVPLILCFIPGLDVYVLRGFTVLQQTPDWYQWLVLLIFTAIYGIRIWRRQQSDT
jgi:hypothetical protein